MRLINPLSRYSRTWLLAHLRLFRRAPSASETRPVAFTRIANWASTTTVSSATNCSGWKSSTSCDCATLAKHFATSSRPGHSPANGTPCVSGKRHTASAARRLIERSCRPAHWLETRRARALCCPLRSWDREPINPCSVSGRAARRLHLRGRACTQRLFRSRNVCRNARDHRGPVLRYSAHRRRHTWN